MDSTQWTVLIAGLTVFIIGVMLIVSGIRMLNKPKEMQ